MSKSKRFSSSIDVINTLTGAVLCHFHYSPLVSGDYESARNLATHFVHHYFLYDDGGHDSGACLQLEPYGLHLPGRYVGHEFYYYYL